MTPSGPRDPRLRPGSSSSTLPKRSFLRHGVVDPEQARTHLGALEVSPDEFLPQIGRAADPDLALASLVSLLEAATPEDRDDLTRALREDKSTTARLLAVLGASIELGHHLCRNPSQWRELADPDLATTRPAAFAVRAALLSAVGADPADPTPIAVGDYAAGADRLRVEYRRWLLRLAARDLAHGLELDDTAAELSDLAAGTLEAALALGRLKLGEPALSCRLAVIAMGKCGGHELNYVSDVDVVFVAEAAEGHEEGPALRVAAQLAAAMMQACSDQTREGTIWPVDAALRPEGSSGPLVRTLASHLGYYDRWAKTWEFQALLKARPVAGDAALGRAYAETIAPFVWQATERPGFVEEVQAMRRRVIAHIPVGEAERQLKLGPGGLRDVEFAVQLLQMVHGRTDEAVRAPTTLSALAQLTARGYVGREDGAAMHRAYTFLRRLEHRIQLWRLRRTHVVPEDEESLRRLGRAMGHLRDPVESLTKEWQSHQREVRRLHEKLFYRPLLSAVARISGEEARLSPEAAQARLAALGYLDPQAALRHLEALTAGVSRTAAIQRALLPAMLGWFADAPDPDAGLFGFRRISESLGSTHWYLRLLRDEGEAAQRMARVLATSRFATDLLRREPDGVAILGKEERLAPRKQESVVAEMSASAARCTTAEAAVFAIRGIRRRELLRTSVADICEPFEVAEVAYALTGLTTATLAATLDAVIRSVEQSRGEPLPTRMAIVAMGRYGGHELGYGSDADVLFVHAPDPGADPQVAGAMAQSVANDVRRLLAAPATDPPLEVDADLRPEGKQGPLVRTLESYAAYYANWSAVWEAQALLRAAALVGDSGLRAEFTALIDPLRFPEEGLTTRQVMEIRRIKARVDDERLPRGADPATHFKLGRGGLSDVEWTVQLLQMRYAGATPQLRTTKTLDALQVAVDQELVSFDDAASLAEAWRLASRARNATVLVRGKPSDQLPRDARERAAVASLMGYEPGQSEAMVNDYLRVARKARAVVDRVFWE